MNLEARSWSVDFHAAVALERFPFFWIFLLGLFLVFYAFSGLGFVFSLGGLWSFLHFQVKVRGVFLSD